VEDLKGLTMDYEAMAAKGTMLGSGAIMMIPDDFPMVELLKVVTDFFAHESCGQCTPCREGTGWLANIMAGVEARTAKAADVDRLHTVASFMGGRTICALSDAAAMPTMSIVKKFGNEIKSYLERSTPA
jgi:NADH-quinone oxidoreductase subunit F